jgi:hypothetical protein
VTAYWPNTFFSVLVAMEVSQLIIRPDHLDMEQVPVSLFFDGSTWPDASVNANGVVFRQA